MVVHVPIERWGDVLFFSDPGFNSVPIAGPFLSVVFHNLCKLLLTTRTAAKRGRDVRCANRHVSICDMRHTTKISHIECIDSKRIAARTWGHVPGPAKWRHSPKYNVRFWKLISGRMLDG
jgi:hypothetical protein